MKIYVRKSPFWRCYPTPQQSLDKSVGLNHTISGLEGVKKGLREFCLFLGLFIVLYNELSNVLEATHSGQVVERKGILTAARKTS